MSLLDEWDHQQALYIGEREARFAAMLQTIEWHTTRLDHRPVVVDLGCGPAAIGRRLLARLPGARYIGVDQDPVLLELGRRVGAEWGADRFGLIDHDVADPNWLTQIPVGQVDVVCSSTALHWLRPQQLASALSAAHRCLRAGGLFLNADHLGFPRGTTADALATWVDATEQAAARRDGALDWDQWWARVRSHDDLAPLCAERDRIYPPEPAADDRRTVLADFAAALSTAGFSEVGTIWQRFDDWIVIGVRS